MSQSIKRIVYGGCVALVTALMYGALVLGFSALMLLITSMEEGEATLTQSTLGFAANGMLYGQGVGMTTGSMRLTIVPLGLWLLLLLLIRAISARTEQHLLGLVAAVVVWDGLQLWFAHAVALPLTDSLGWVAGKASLIMALGYCLAWLRPQTPVRRMLHDLWLGVPVVWRKLLHSSVVLALTVAVVMAVASLIAVAVWVFRAQDALQVVWEHIGMQTGSRILTTLLCLIWLPNLMILAMGWLTGSDIHLGTLAQFSLWQGSATNLPAIPVFAIFPQAVHADIWRLVVMNIPAYAVIIVFGVMVWTKRFYRIVQPWSEVREAVLKRQIDWMRLVARVALPCAVALCAIVFLAVLMTVCVLVSGGSLGERNLQFLGLESAQTTSAFIRPVVLGCVGIWLLALMCLAMQYVWVIARRQVAVNLAVSHNKDIARKNTQVDKDSDSSVEISQKIQEKEHKSTKPRTIQSSASSANHSFSN